MSTTRRNFMVSGLTAGAAAPLMFQQAPRWLSGAQAPEDNILVVVQLRGGCDMINMLPEVDNKTYQAARPNLKLAKNKVLSLHTGASHYWHPGLAAFKALYDAGDLSIIQNVGYPTPNLSHFTSEKKWYSADPSTTISKDGWLANYLHKGYSGTFQIPAIDIESRQSPAFTGYRLPVFRNPTQFSLLFDPLTSWDNTVEKALIKSNAVAARPSADSNLKYVAGGIVQAIADSDLLVTQGLTYKPKVTYPNSTLARDLQLAARYITSGLKTQVYYTSSGGFDNHANEITAGNSDLGRFRNLLTNVSGSVKAFLDDVKVYGYNKKVVVMLWTEFGRRFGENGSLGTDHGHGGHAFLAGEPVKGGRVGNMPDLSKAKTPYNRYYIPFDSLSTDFRSLYATVIDKWLGGDHTKIIGGKFPLLSSL